MQILKYSRNFIFLILIVFAMQVRAEYNHELGVGGGVSFYLGDANKKGVFNRPGMSLTALYRYNIDTRWAVKAKLSYAKIQGDTRDEGLLLPNQDYAEFKRGLVDFGITAEWNFFDIGESGYYKGDFKATPYICLGVGLLAFQSNKSMFNVNIPIGIGGKWKINKRLTLGLEWTIHKTFTDALDVTDSTNEVLSDPYKTGKVGFFDTDWYSIANLYLTFNLYNVKQFCR